MKFYTITPKPYLKLRSLATVIDYSIFVIFFYVFVRSFGQQADDGQWEVNGTLVLVMPAFWFLYFVVLEAVNQATPGHDICRLKVIKLDGQRATLTDIFKRRACDVIDIGLYGVPAFICISKTAKHQRVGDLWADTVVVKAADITEKEVIF